MHTSYVGLVTQGTIYALDCRRKPLEFKTFSWGHAQAPLKQWNAPLSRIKPIGGGGGWAQ